jgi:hypothetical protein
LSWALGKYPRHLLLVTNTLIVSQQVLNFLGIEGSRILIFDFLRNPRIKGYLLKSYTHPTLEKRLGGPM